MSEPSGFISGEFYARSPLQIILDYQVAASGVYEEINFGPGSPLYQLAKIVQLREYQMELLVQAVTSGLSVTTAYGDFLDKHGESMGIFRKDAQVAGGYVQLTVTAPTHGANYDLLNTEYFTKTNLKYLRAESGTSQRIYRAIAFTRGYSNVDQLPLPFTWIDATGYINSQIDGSGTEYFPTWNQTYQYLNWSDLTGISTGDVYYVEVNNQLKIQDDVVSENTGTGANVGANTITNWVNALLPSSTTVNNPFSTTGGTEIELDDDYRDRLLRAKNRSFTLANIRTIAEGVNGVKSAHVYQAIGTDRTTVSGAWSLTTLDYVSGIHVTGVYSGAFDVVSGALWSQQFTPAQDVLGLKRVVLRGKRIGYPPSLVVGLRNANQVTYLTSGIFDTFDMSPPATTGQDMNVDLTYLDLDYTEDYRLDFWCGNKTGASGITYWNENYWELFTGAMSGNLDSTGYLYDPTGNSHESNLLLKTQYGAAAFNVDLAIADGYSFDSAASTIDEKLDWVDGSGFAPIGVNYTINESERVYCYYKGTLYVKRDTFASFNSIQGRINSSVEIYMEGLEPGENVVYSEIYYLVMNDPDVWRVDDLRIYEFGGVELEDEDIYIGDSQVAIFGGSVLNQG